MKNYTVLILVKATSLAIRIKKMLEDIHICVVDVGNNRKFFSAINNSKTNISLVILDLDVSEEHASELIQKSRKKLNNVPIILLSSGKEKKFYIKAMVYGATDFIVKPFKNQTLLNKVMKYLNENNFTNVEFVTLDLNCYIKGELKKASKGNFPISLMFLHFENTKGTNINNPKVNSLIFENIQNLFWDTDVFIRFASKYYLGVFPFCDEKKHRTNSKKT